MLNRSASLAMSTSVLKALPDELDNKTYLPSILYLSANECQYLSFNFYNMVFKLANVIFDNSKVHVG